MGLIARALRRLCPWLAPGRSAAPAGCFWVVDAPVSNIANERFQPPKNGLFFPLYVPVTDNFPCKFFGAVSKLSNEREFSELGGPRGGPSKAQNRPIRDSMNAFVLVIVAQLSGAAWGPVVDNISFKTMTACQAHAKFVSDQMVEL